MSTKPMKDANPAAFLLRASALMHSQQYMREIYQNSVEAGATDIRFTFCKSIYKTQGIKRAVIIDNGPGMNKKDLEKYTNETNSSSKAVGQIDQNFGVGLKVSTLPFNQYGVIVISRTKEQPFGSMIWLHMDKGLAGARGLTSAENSIFAHDEDGETFIDYVLDFEEVIDRNYDKFTIDSVDWLNWWDNNTKHKYGTAVILCGNDFNHYENTFESMRFKGYPYLNERYLTYPVVPRASLPSGPKCREKLSFRQLESPIDRLNKRSKELDTIYFQGWSIRSFIKNLGKAPEGRYGDSSISKLKFNQSIVYKNEVYGDFGQLPPQTIAAVRNSWGIYYKNVGKRITLLIEPPVYTQESKRGVFPNQERSKLSWKESETSEQTEHLPLDELKKYFQENMPKEIIELIEEEALEGLTKDHESKAVKKMEKWLKIPKENRKIKKGDNGLLIADKNGEVLGGIKLGDLFGSLQGKANTTSGNEPSEPTESKPKTKEELEAEEAKKKARKAAEAKRREAPRIRFIKKDHDDAEERFLVDGHWQGAFYEPPSAKGNHGNFLYINQDHNLLHGYVNVAEDWLSKKQLTFTRNHIIEWFVKPFWEEYAALSILHGRTLPELKKDPQAYSAERLTWALLGCQAFFEMDMTRLYREYKKNQVLHEVSA